MNKKGVELPTNALIIILLAVVAGGIILVFFLGGAGPLTQTIKDWFLGATAGTDRTFAVELCNKYCLDARDVSPDLQRTSPFCTKYWNIDENHDGEAESTMAGDVKLYNQYFCNANAASKAKDKGLLKSVEDKSAKATHLSVGCAISC